MNENYKKINPSIQVIPFPEIENAYVVISARWRKTIGDVTQDNVKKNMSFFYDCGNGIGVEWEPNFGPITIIESCDADHKDAKPHFFYQFYTGQGNWMQLLVDELGLSGYFITGRYCELFNALRSCVIPG
jgi:hypothetical protein